jgi:hypothetical protein
MCRAVKHAAGIRNPSQNRKSGLRRTRHLSGKRKPDPERRAAVIPIFCRYMPVVRLDDGVRDGQAHAHAIRLDGQSAEKP